MVDFNKIILKKLIEVAHVERAQNGKIYKKGCFIIKLSACDDSVVYLEEDREIERRYAVIIPRDNINQKYLFYAFSRVFPQFLSRYQTTINLQFDMILKMELEVHEEPETQRKIVEMMELCENAERQEKQWLEYCKTMKQYFLGKMMI